MILWAYVGYTMAERVYCRYMKAVLCLPLEEREAEMRRACQTLSIETKEDEWGYGKKDARCVCHLAAEEMEADIEKFHRIMLR